MCHLLLFSSSLEPAQDICAQADDGSCDEDDVQTEVGHQSRCSRQEFSGCGRISHLSFLLSLDLRTLALSRSFRFGLDYRDLRDFETDVPALEEGRFDLEFI